MNRNAGGGLNETQVQRRLDQLRTVQSSETGGTMGRKGYVVWGN
jgi:hypothetical protein